MNMNRDFISETDSNEDWPNELEKLSKDAQARLNALPGSKDNKFTAGVWEFRSNDGCIITIDFDTLQTLIKMDTLPQCFNRDDLITVIKLAWLASAESVTPMVYSVRLSGLAVFFNAIIKLRLNYIDKDNLSELLKFFLMHRWEKGRLSMRVRPMSVSKFRCAWDLDTWKYIFKLVGIEIFSNGLSKQVVKQSLEQSLLDSTDGELTYSDWVEGGSYDQLTLDYGQYYIEHCLTIFEKYYPLAVALSRTFDSVDEFAQRVNINRETTSCFVLHALEGKSPQEIHDEMVRQNQNHSFKTIEVVFSLTIARFRAAYEVSRFTAAVTEEASISKFLRELSLDLTQPNIDRLRVIIFNWLKYGDIEPTKRLLENCEPKVEFLAFKVVLDKFRDELNQTPIGLPSANYYTEIGLRTPAHLDTNNRHPRQLIRLIEHAGLTSFVALTGWRKSEFGFPLAAIIKSKNDDKLDQYAFPFRYQVQWHVKKTSGKNLVKREITFDTYLLAERLYDLMGTALDEPCLYRTSSVNRNKFRSVLAVNRAVIGVWSHYVWNYTKFRALDEWKSWCSIASKKITTLTESEKSERERLLAVRSISEWENFKVDSNLKEAWERCRADWPIMEFYIAERETKDKKNWLWRYTKKTLREDWMLLLDEKLSPKTKEWIASLSGSDFSSMIVTRTIMVELVADCLYPRPHALRHMWAEAVYRRFDGDAGWMIRSQFKHISKSMWLAYVRNKDNKGTHQLAKSRVTNSLVKNYFAKGGSGYAGKFHIWLRRLMRQTKVLTTEEQIDFVERLVESEISDIKASPWGYCLLKRRTLSKARCIELGKPQRHNASPNLCLGCPHNLMTSENVEWLILHLYSHVQALQNPKVPNILKASSYELVRAAVAQVRIIDPNHDALPELQNSLKNFDMSKEI